MTGFAIFRSEISGFPISFADISGFDSFHSDITGFENLFRSSIILYFASEISELFILSSDIATFLIFALNISGSFTFSSDIFHKYTPRELDATWKLDNLRRQRGVILAE